MLSVLLESPHQGDSNEITQYSIFNSEKKSPSISLNLQQGDFFQGSQERVQNSRGKRSISVRATEVLLYLAVTCGFPLSRMITNN